MPQIKINRSNIFNPSQISYFTPSAYCKVDLLLFLDLFHKMATAGHFGYPKITFDHITRHLKKKYS